MRAGASSVNDLGVGARQGSHSQLQLHTGRLDVETI